MRRVLVGIQMLIVKLRTFFLEGNLEVRVPHPFMMPVTKSTLEAREQESKVEK